MTENTLTLTGKSIAERRGGTISCLSGVIWITWRSGPDVLLKAGESCVLPKNRNSLLQAIKSATARFLPSEANRRELPSLPRRATVRSPELSTHR